MVSYIYMNTKLLAKATFDFENNFFKLANNAVFGKTMENLRTRKMVDLVSSSQEDPLRKLVDDHIYHIRYSAGTLWPCTAQKVN